MTVVWPRINNNNKSTDIESNEEFTNQDTSLQMEEPILFMDDSFQRPKNIYRKLYKSNNKLLINKKN